MSFCQQYDAAEKRRASHGEVSADTQASSQGDVVISLVEETHHQREPMKSDVLDSQATTKPSNEKLKSIETVYIIYFQWFWRLKCGVTVLTKFFNSAQCI